MATMAEILHEENQKLKDRLASVEEKLQYEIQVNKTLTEQAQLIDSSLPSEVKTIQYANAYGTFEQYSSGYGHVGIPPEGSEKRLGAADIDRVLIILYEVQAPFEEDTKISSQIPKSGNIPLNE